MITRRECLQGMAAAGVGFRSLSGWMAPLAAAAQNDPQRSRSCILLWMPGGPSQLDTFDPKPGHANAGPVKAIETSVPGVQISEYLPNIAKQMQHGVIVRSMSTEEGDHQRATYHLRTGYRPNGPVRYPTLGSLVSKELAPASSELPGFVSIASASIFGPAAYGPGFLGPQFAPMTVGNAQYGQPQQQNAGPYGPPLHINNIDAPSGVSLKQADARFEMLRELDARFAEHRPGTPVASHLSAYERALRLMRSKSVEAFDLDDEPAELRIKYGKNQFGQGCLLARRLVERGVPFVEVSLSSAPGQQNAVGWDTHQNNFQSVKALCESLDAGWTSLVEDLSSRGLLDTTLIVWMGEFGRTPQIVRNDGRDHFSKAWSTVLMGGGIKGGQVVGKTSADGMQVVERPVSAPDFLGTVCKAIGVDPEIQNPSNVGRPIRIVDPAAKPIKEALV